MKKYILVLVIAVASALCMGIAREVHANPVFGYTHLLPSPFTIPGGRVILGTDVALGVTDFLQVGTNIVRDMYKTYNANAKISLIDFEGFALSPMVEWQTFNYRDISDFNPDLRVTSWLPGMVAAVEVLPSLAWFVGGNLNFTKTKLVDNNIQTSGLVRGAEVGSDLSWAYNMGGGGRSSKSHAKSSGRVGNVVSTGVTYDFSYKLFGVGLSHHWPGFHLGVHYYPAAKKFPVQPIIAGGVALDI